MSVEANMFSVGARLFGMVIWAIFFSFWDVIVWGKWWMQKW